MTLIESSTSLLEKYANLHTAMEEARTEAAQFRSEMQLCQGQIQDLLEHRQRMQEATHQACQEQEILQQELDQHGRELESLQNEHDQVMRMRYDHAQHVQSMIQRRQETTRKDYEQSLQDFQTACQQFLEGNIQQQPPPPPPPVPTSSSTTRREDDKAPPSSNSVSQQDPSHHDKENHPNNHSDSFLNGTAPCPSPNTNIMKINWKGLFSQILSTTNEQTLRDVLQELVPDSEQQKTTDPSDQESPLTLNVDQSLTEQDTVTTVILHQKTIVGREDESKDAVVLPDGQDTINNKQVLSTSSSSSFLFSQCLQVIDKLQLIKTQMADEAQAKLVALQAQYNQALQDHDHVHKDHAQWVAKITRQRSQKEQLSRQLDRLHNDVKRLHQQMDQVHSQTLELQQQQQQQQQYHESQTGSKRQKTRLLSHNHDQETSKIHSALKVRNPYLQTAKTNKPKRSLYESHESFLMTTQGAEKENDYPTNHHQQQHHHHQSMNKSASSLHQEGRQADHSSSSRRAIISPLAETSIHRTLTSATTTSSTTTRTSVSTDNYHESARDSSTTAARHHHRILGRVRGARDFGVSLSLESTSVILSHNTAAIDNSTEDNANRSRACLMATHHNMDEMSFPAQQKPTTSSSNRMTPLVESTTRNTGSSTGNEPAVVSVAKSRDSTTTRLLHRRLHDHHDSSSHDDHDHDSCLSQESIPPHTTGCEHDDDHDNDDPVFHFVFRKE